MGMHQGDRDRNSTFLISLFRVRTVNPSEIAVGFIGKAAMESHYKRLQRFFREFEVDYSEIAKTVERLMKIPEPWVLSCDRTEWQYGDTTFNILSFMTFSQPTALSLVLEVYF
jgi:hypothetical protein